MKKRKSKPKLFKNATEELEFYWKVLIKAMADFKSEISGGTDGLTAHHIAGKPCDALRYELLNGVCCTSGEHKFGYHNTGRVEQYREITKKLRGEGVFEKLQEIKRDGSEGKAYYRAFLLAMLEPYKAEIEAYLAFKDYKSKKVKDQYNYLLEQLGG